MNAQTFWCTQEFGEVAGVFAYIVEEKQRYAALLPPLRIDHSWVVVQ